MALERQKNTASLSSQIGTVAPRGFAAVADGIGTMWGGIAGVAQKGADLAFKILSERAERQGKADARAKPLMRDDQGRLVLDTQADTMTVYGAAYQKEREAYYVNQTALDVEKRMAQLAREHRLDPEAFSQASEAYLDEVKNAAAPAVKGLVEDRGRMLQVDWLRKVDAERFAQDFKNGQGAWAEAYTTISNELTDLEAAGHGQSERAVELRQLRAEHLVAGLDVGYVDQGTVAKLEREQKVAGAAASLLAEIARNPNGDFRPVIEALAGGPGAPGFRKEWAGLSVEERTKIGRVAEHVLAERRQTRAEQRQILSERRSEQAHARAMQAFQRSEAQRAALTEANLSLIQMKLSGKPPTPEEMARTAGRLAAVDTDGSVARGWLEGAMSFANSLESKDREKREADASVAAALALNQRGLVGRVENSPTVRAALDRVVEGSLEAPGAGAVLYQKGDPQRIAEMLALVGETAGVPQGLADYLRSVLQQPEPTSETLKAARYFQALEGTPARETLREAIGARNFDFLTEIMPLASAGTMEPESYKLIHKKHYGGGGPTPKLSDYFPTVQDYEAARRAAVTAVLEDERRKGLTLFEGLQRRLGLGPDTVFDLTAIAPAMNLAFERHVRMRDIRDPKIAEQVARDAWAEVSKTWKPSRFNAEGMIPASHGRTLNVVAARHPLDALAERLIPQDPEKAEQWARDTFRAIIERELPGLNLTAAEKEVIRFNLRNWSIDDNPYRLADMFRLRWTEGFDANGLPTYALMKRVEGGGFVTVRGQVDYSPEVAKAGEIVRGIMDEAAERFKARQEARDEAIRERVRRTLTLGTVSPAVLDDLLKQYRGTAGEPLILEEIERRRAP